MEFTETHVPTDWEGCWRREKERRRRAIEEGGERAEEDKRELRRIVAYNDAKMMGMVAHESKQSWGSKVGTSPGGLEEELDRGKGDDGYAVLTYSRQTSAEEMYEALREFWESSLLTDLTLTLSNVDGLTFQVHSPVLAAVSTLIRDRLRERDRSRSGKGEITDAEVQSWSLSLGPELDPVGIQAVLEFAYSGDVATLNRDTVAQIRAAAHTLGVPRVLELCDEEEEREKHVMKRSSVYMEKQRMRAAEQMKASLQSLRQLWEERVGCDLVLDVDGTSFHVHKAILAASSDYFRGMFTCGMKESRHSRVTLPFLPASELQDLIGFSYSGALPLSWGHVFEVACLALRLQFRPALSLCLDFMQREMEADSCLDVASFARAYGMPELLEEADDFVLRNFMDVSTSPKFPDLPEERLLEYLLSDGLCVPTELVAFRAVVSWVQADPEERLVQAGPLMRGVRFPLMTFREFREVRAVSLRMECSGNQEVELYASALKEFGLDLSQDCCRVRRPKEVLLLVGGDRLNPDVGQRLPSRELWFANALRSGMGLMKDIEWRRLGVMPEEPRFRHGVAVMEGTLYVVGGCHFYTKNDTMKSAYRYDPMLDSWQRIADMLEFRSNFPVVACGQHLYAIGGDREINTNVDSVEVYNPESDSWSYGQPLDQPMSGHAVTVVNGEIYISGGFNRGYQCQASTLLYHPDTRTARLADMAHDRAQHCMETLRGCLYVAGGVCNLRMFYGDQLACEVYEPTADMWSAFTSLPVPHVSAASAVLEEKIYVLGGYCQDDYKESRLIHRHDPSTGRWQSLGHTPGATNDMRACCLGLPAPLRV